MQPLGELLTDNSHREHWGEGDRSWVEGVSGQQLWGGSSYRAREGRGQCWGEACEALTAEIWTTPVAG
jgi:hypothetical protein